MISTDNKILNAVIDTLSIEDLQNIINKKKSINQPLKLTYSEEYTLRFEEWFKNKMYAPNN